jgi:hypothetical protein
MKTETDIRDRLRVLVGEELDRRVAQAAERLPRRCVHNHRHPLDQRKQVNGEPNDTYNRITSTRGLPVLQTIGLCMLGSEDPETWGGTICEEPLDAKRCPVFTPLKGKAELMQEFEEQLRDAEWVQANLPEVHALLWVLEEVQVPSVPWWKRLLFRFKIIKLEPVTPSIDPTKLLSQSSEDP